MNRITGYIMIGLIVILGILTIVELSDTGKYTYYSDDGWEEPPPDPIMLAPNQRDISHVSIMANVSETDAMLALIETDNDVKDAIRFLSDSNR